MGVLVAQLPGADFAADLNDAVLGLAKGVENAFVFEVDGKGSAGEGVDVDAVANVAARGVVANKGRGTLPDLTTAAGVLIVAIAEGLVGGEPEALNEKECEQPRRYALRTIEAKAANPGEGRDHSVDEVGRYLF